MSFSESPLIRQTLIYLVERLQFPPKGKRKGKGKRKEKGNREEKRKGKGKKKKE